MKEINKRIMEIGVVPVIKLNNPERDAQNLAKALVKGGLPVAEVTEFSSQSLPHLTTMLAHTQAQHQLPGQT